MFGRFSWNATIPSPVQVQPHELTEITSKVICIMQDGSENIAPVVVVKISEMYRANKTDPRKILLAFYIPKPIDDKVNIVMSLAQHKNDCLIPLIQQNSKVTPLRKHSHPNEDTSWCTVRSWLCKMNPAVKKCDVFIDLQIEIEDLDVPKTKTKIEVLSDPEPTLSQALENLYLNEESSDVKIICDAEEFPCHKVILSSRSDVFKTMFSIPDVKEQRDGIVKIDDVSAKTMKTFLKFMYKDDLELEEIDCNLLIAADKYDFKRLFNICLRQIERTIDVTNVMEITVAAYLLEHKCNQLLKKASDFIIINRGSIKKCKYWDQIKCKHPAIAAKVMELTIFADD